MNTAEAIKAAKEFADRITDAAYRGVSPPQNWTSEAVRHIEALSALSASAEQQPTNWTNRQLCDLLPESVMWGDNLTPELVREILSRAEYSAPQASQPTESVSTAEDYLRNKYGAYRGHFAWRELEDAFNASKAKASQPVALTDEREAFERAMLARTSALNFERVQTDKESYYLDDETQNRWIGWEERALLSATSQPSEAEIRAQSQIDELGKEIARLQDALAFWLPNVPDTPGEMRERIANDAYLLVGMDGNLPDNFKCAEELGWIKLQEASQEQQAPAVQRYSIDGQSGHVKKDPQGMWVKFEDLAIHPAPAQTGEKTK